MLRTLNSCQVAHVSRRYRLKMFCKLALQWMLGRVTASTSTGYHANMSCKHILSQRKAAWPMCLGTLAALTANRGSMSSLVPGALVACGGMQLVQWPNAWTASAASTPVASKTLPSSTEFVHVVHNQEIILHVLFAIKSGRSLTSYVTLTADQIHRTQGIAWSAPSATTSTTLRALAHQ